MIRREQQVWLDNRSWLNSENTCCRWQLHRSCVCSYWFRFIFISGNTHVFYLHLSHRTPSHQPDPPKATATKIVLSDSIGDAASAGLGSCLQYNNTICKHVNTSWIKQCYTTSSQKKSLMEQPSIWEAAWIRETGEHNFSLWSTVWLILRLNQIQPHSSRQACNFDMVSQQHDFIMESFWVHSALTTFATLHAQKYISDLVYRELLYNLVSEKVGILFKM